MELSIKELKEKALNLDDLEILIKEFEKKKLLQHNYIKKINNPNLNEAFFGIKLLHTNIFEKQLINERAQSLVHNLTKLKITLITNDFCKARKIIFKYLYKNYVNIKYLVKENKNFKKNIDDLNNVYSNFFKNLENIKNRKFTLEKKKFMLFIKKLKKVYMNQEIILSKGSIYFIKYSKEVIDKEKVSNCNV